jgi:hypothetical protein
MAGDLSMRRHRWKLLGAAAALAVVALVVAGVMLLRDPPAPRLTRANADKLHYGMTGAEVEALLGPPGDYRTGTTDSNAPPGKVRWIDLYGDKPRPSPEIWIGWNHYVWESDEVTVQIQFDDEPDKQGVIYPKKARWPDLAANNIKVAVCEGMTRQEQSALDNFLWRLKRQWRKWFPER